jgi:imidazoleglycerol-phosphate dehydratase
MRKSVISRKTSETDIRMLINLDGTGRNSIHTGIGFFNHMLEIFSRHSRIDLEIECDGDTHVDAHHTVEDIGICLGTAFAEAIGEGRGITRYSDVILPMDEALVLCAIDVSGRGDLNLDVKLTEHMVGTMDTGLLEEFLSAFIRKAGITVHIKMLSGKNTHHILEACFKAFARALRAAIKIDPDFAGEIPSTKGILR